MTLREPFSGSYQGRVKDAVVRASWLAAASARTNFEGLRE